jgi:hypothetical protein
MDGLGSLRFQIGGQPFHGDVFLEAKSYFEQHTRLAPNDPEPYYCALREHFHQQARGQVLNAAAPLPPDLRRQYARDDAMAYLNLMYRRKADIVTRSDEREELLKMADDLVDQVKEIKTQKSRNR